MKKCSSIFISILISTGTLCIGSKSSAQTSDYNGGEITVESSKNVGTEFIILILIT